MKKKWLFVTILGGLLLASCGGNESSSSDPGSSTPSSDESSSSSWSEPYPIPSTSSSDDGSDGISVTLRNQYISEGTSFLDSAGQRISFRNKGVTTTITSGYSLTLTNETFGGTYSGTQLLPEGLYKADYSYVSGKVTYTTSIPFSVRPYEAGTGGYKKAEAGYTVDEYPNLSLFGLRGVEGTCPSVGSPKILVVPLTFQGLDAYTEAELSNIEAAYTSETLESTAFHSLKRYYEISSYGKLTLDITIHEQFEMPMTTTEFETYGDYAFVELFEELLDDMNTNGESISQYDTNGDGYLDGVHFIYKTDKALDGDFWWQYTSGFRPTEEIILPTGVTTRPALYFFSSYSYIMNGYYGTYPDTHTIIHETGHMLGVDDYYDYYNNEVPAGMADMMDLNVGDHCAYSKMRYGWADPYVVDGSSDHFEITLRPFESSGEFILLRNTSDAPWNGTMFDEYLTLSYYTPTGLNERDSEGYRSWADPSYGEGGTYSVSGLQVYHVDSRAVYNYPSSSIYRYWDSENDDDTYISRIAASNTPQSSGIVNASGSFNRGPYRLMEAITSDGIDHFGTSNRTWFGKNSNLFGIGDAYGGSGYSNSKMSAYFTNGTSFNDGSSLDYNFHVTAMDEEGITVRFDRIGA